MTRENVIAAKCRECGGTGFIETDSYPGFEDCFSCHVRNIEAENAKLYEENRQLLQDKQRLIAVLGEAKTALNWTNQYGHFKTCTCPVCNALGSIEYILASVERKKEQTGSGIRLCSCGAQATHIHPSLSPPYHQKCDVCEDKYQKDIERDMMSWGNIDHG